MQHSELLKQFTKRNKPKPTQQQIADILGKKIGVISARAARDSQYSVEEVRKIGNHYSIDLLNDSYIDNLANDYANNKMQEFKKGAVQVLFRPDVRFSAGYGIEVYEENTKEYMTLDSRLFMTDRGTSINPNMCEILTVAGNSMSPKWEDGDRFILDKSVTEFIDGQVFAFRHNGECYIKEICLLGKRAKAIPLNKEYDEFYIEPDDELTIFGRVVPRVRL